MATILVVEDFVDNRSVVELILRDADYKVWSAADGVDGIRIASQVRPDLILMDLAMPKMDGFEATRQLKLNPETAYIPVIAFTAQVDTETVSRAVSAGCVAVVEKPFEIDQMLEKIECCLKASRHLPKHHSVAAHHELLAIALGM